MGAWWLEWSDTHRTGVSEVLVLDVGAGRADLPGVSKELRRRLHNALASGEVILRVTVEVATQPTNPATKTGCQSHIHTHAWPTAEKWKM